MAYPRSSVANGLTEFSARPARFSRVVNASSRRLKAACRCSSSRSSRCWNDDSARSGVRRIRPDASLSNRRRRVSRSCRMLAPRAVERALSFCRWRETVAAGLAAAQRRASQSSAWDLSSSVRNIWLASRCRVMATARCHSPRSGTASSAAPEGVGARTSATRSAMLKSTSCPTALITGSSEARMARASASSLNAQRSSNDPPPRPIISTSHSARLLAVARAFNSSGAACSP